MSICGFWPHGARGKFFAQILTAFLDLLSGMFLTLGLLSTGGAIFVILYNSCPAWTALLSRFILGKKLKISVTLVCIGLCMNIIGSRAQLNHSSDGTCHGSEEEEDYTKLGQENDQSFGVMAGCV